MIRMIKRGDLTPYEMQLELNNIGYDMDYLETLSSSRIISMFDEEFPDWD